MFTHLFTQNEELSKKLERVYVYTRSYTQIRDRGADLPPPFLTVKSLLMENTDSAFTKKYMYTYLKKYIPAKYHSKLPPTSVVKGLLKKKDVQMVGPQEVLKKFYSADFNIQQAVLILLDDDASGSRPLTKEVRIFFLFIPS